MFWTIKKQMPICQTPIKNRETISPITIRVETLYHGKNWRTFKLIKSFTFIDQITTKHPFEFSH
ncbi:hypothetical protein B1219_04115 [Pseudomonas ogarae]|nr:hypothetical protein B1219_04115 [Pseudomonas ogarae]OPG80171.1 hypothetical protein B1218_06615 [Pseudomonas ogarae]